MALLLGGPGVGYQAVILAPLILILGNKVLATVFKGL